MSDQWDRRVRRAGQLAKEWPYAAELLRFFGELYRLQGEIFRQIETLEEDEVPGKLLSFSPRLFDLVAAHGTEHLKQIAEKFRRLPDEHWERLLMGRRETLETNEPQAFYARALWEPLAAWDVRRAKKPPKAVAEDLAGTCPGCRSRPIVSILRGDPVAETVRRTLFCSLCSTEWDYSRVQCPNCREERPEKLPRYAAPDIPWIRIEACDTCGKFLKSVDVTRNPDAEPVVDELASTPLDVIAHDRGYEKVTFNLAGI